MEDGDRKSLALKCLNMVQTKAEEHHAESKKLTEEYEKDRAEIDKDPQLAMEEAREEQQLVEEIEALAAPSQPKLWQKMKDRSETFSEHFQIAQERARDKLVHEMQAEIDTMSDGRDKDIKMQALHMAELKQEAAETEATAEGEDAAIETERRELAMMKDGPEKALREKALQVLQSKGSQRHTEAAVLMEQYEKDRAAIDADETVAELEHKEEQALAESMIAAEEAARQAVVAEEAATIAFMAPSDRKVVAETALEIAELKAEAAAAETEAIMEEEEADRGIAKLANEPDNPRKQLKLAALKALKRDAEQHHAEANVLMDAEAILENRSEHVEQTARNKALAVQETKVESMSDGPLKKLKRNALAMARLKAEAAAEELEAEEEDAEVKEEMEQIALMDDGPRKTLALKAMQMVQMKAVEHHMEAQTKLDEYMKQHEENEAADPVTATQEKVMEDAMLSKVQDATLPTEPIEKAAQIASLNDSTQPTSPTNKWDKGTYKPVHTRASSPVKRRESVNASANAKQKAEVADLRSRQAEENARAANNQLEAHKTRARDAQLTAAQTTIDARQDEISSLEAALEKARHEHSMNLEILQKSREEHKKKAEEEEVATQAKMADDLMQAQLKVVDAHGAHDAESKARAMLEILKIRFDEADEDMSGQLDERELASVYRLVYRENGVSKNIKKVEAEVTLALAQFDTDSDGLINFNEYVTMYCTSEELRFKTEDDVKSAMLRMAPDCNMKFETERLAVLVREETHKVSASHWLKVSAKV